MMVIMQHAWNGLSVLVAIIVFFHSRCVFHYHKKNNVRRQHSRSIEAFAFVSILINVLVIGIKQCTSSPLFYIYRTVLYVYQHFIVSFTVIFVALSLAAQTNVIKCLLGAHYFILTILPHAIFVLFFNTSIHLLQHGFPPSKITVLLAVLYSMGLGSFMVLHSGPTLLSYALSSVLSFVVVLKYNATDADPFQAKGSIPSSFILRCFTQALVRFSTYDSEVYTVY